MAIPICSLALRMDVLRYDAWHDPLTALFDRRSFDRLLARMFAPAHAARDGWVLKGGYALELRFRQCVFRAIVNTDSGHGEHGFRGS